MPVLFLDSGVTFAVYFLIGAYFLIGFGYNAIQIVLKDPSIRGMLLVNKVTRQWTYCVSCQSPRPPRTHHCHVCNICVLRRDHHCVALANFMKLLFCSYLISLTTRLERGYTSPHAYEQPVGKHRTLYLSRELFHLKRTDGRNSSAYPRDSCGFG
ncbi:unnamed protein product [Echinostoma caproni]|uniref:Palmitoyltransferase n=1 Tax=Echinostoma caproni TaxID=27848 RepID=A0A183A4H1_9TREM|nr:unnamed protein product [Echinostoma caproni]